MDSPSTSPRGESSRPPVLLVLWVLVVLSVWLGTRGLNEPDEGRYAEIGREMHAGSSWLLPHLNGFPHFQKPPLVYWLTAVGYHLLGVNEWGARFPSAIAAFGATMCTWWIGRRLFRAEVATTAALVLLGSLEFFGLARMLTPDMLMSFWITASIACWVRAKAPTEPGEPPAKGWIWGFFICQGLGFLTKGPMALVVPWSAALGWIWASRSLGNRVRIPWKTGLLLTLGIALSWYIVISIRQPGTLEYFVGDELVKRVMSKAHGRSKPFWFFIPVVIGGVVPWSFFLPWLIQSAWRRLRHRATHPLEPWQGLVLGWTVIPFLVLSVSGSKLLTYVLPLFPAIALVLAWAWHRHAILPRAAARWAWRIGAVLLAVLTVGLIGMRFTRFGGNLPVWPLAVPLFLVAYLIRERWKATSPDDLSRMAVAASTVWIAFILQVPTLNPILKRQSTVRDIAAVARDYLGADGVAFSYNIRACGFGFYLGRTIGIRSSEADLVLAPTPEESRRLIETAEDAARLAKPGQPVCGLISEEHWGREFSEPQWKELARTGAFVLVGRRGAGSAAP